MPAIAEVSAVRESARRRITWRLLPFLFLLYIIAFLDRVNIGYAGLEMTRDLGFSDSVFGLGGGIFFIGYFIFEIPGALIVERWSARKWIARILISWGVVTVLIAAVHTPVQFYAARFLLGLAEAGFFPGIVVYLTHWFTRADRAKTVAMFMAAIPTANIIGSPFAGLLLGVHLLGLPGWRWLFIVEGVPAVIFGVITLFYLTDWPAQAHWLPGAEREWISSELQREKEEKTAALKCTIWQALGRREVLLLTVVYFLAVIGLYGFILWLPAIVKRATGLSNLSVTLLSALPYVVGLAATLWNGWHSDHTRERRWHTAWPLLAGGASLGLALLVSQNLLVAFALTIIFGACTTTFMPAFWALPADLLTDSAAAAAIGLVNSVGNLGGFVGPYAIGYLSKLTHSFTAGLLVLVAAMLASGVLVLTLPRVPARKA
jgi:sugar phosphate permease